MTTLASGAPSFEAKVTNPKLQLDPERPGNASHSRSSGFQCHVGCFVSLSSLLVSDPLRLKDLS